MLKVCQKRIFMLLSFIASVFSSFVERKEYTAASGFFFVGKQLCKQLNKQKLSW